MAPNLFIALRWVVQPHKWCQSRTETSPRTKLYFSKEPVPGIYAIDKCARHFLVAIKPDGSDRHGIFRHNPEENSLNYRPIDLNVAATVLAKEKYEVVRNDETQLGAVDKGSIVIDAKGRYNGAITTTKVSTAGHDSTSKSLPEILAQTEAPIRFSPTIPDNDHLFSHEQGSASTLNLTFNGEYKPFFSVVPPAETLPSKSFEYFQDATAANSTHSLKLGSNIGEPRHVSFTHLTHPIRDARHHNHSTTALPPFHNVSNIDMPGYKYLAKPLEVIYSPIHGRRLFKAELKARTFYQKSCARKGCHFGPAGYKCCHEKKERNWVLLDDGDSLVCEKTVMRLYKDNERKETVSCLIDKLVKFCKRKDTRSANNNITLQIRHSSLDCGYLATVMHRLKVTSREKKIGTEGELLFNLVDKDPSAPYYKAQCEKKMRASRKLMEQRRGRCIEIYYGDDELEDYVEDYMKVWDYVTEGKGYL